LQVVNGEGRAKVAQPGISCPKWYSTLRTLPD
jgi:hypothetical protein